MKVTKKVLLMGKSGAGKTSMRSIIFANCFSARDTMRLEATSNVEHSHLSFLGNLTLNLWDCGGQDTFYENYLDRQRDDTFRKVALLIYVFDVDSRDTIKDLHYFQNCLKALEEYSPQAKLFILIHKMDLVPRERKAMILKAKQDSIRNLTANFDTVCYGTSIWDETLYRAWSSIVNALIPNGKVLQGALQKFAEICEAKEVVLFERSTFLVISHISNVHYKDSHRFEKISNIIKQFKLSCSKSHGSQALGGLMNVAGSGFHEIKISNATFSSVIEEIMTSTFIMVIFDARKSTAAAVKWNIKHSAPAFQKLIKSPTIE